MDYSKLKIPLGFRFQPSGVELLNTYLRKKVCGEELPWNNDAIKEVDVYNQHPSYLFSNVVDSSYNNDIDVEIQGYFITPLKRVGKRYIRRVGEIGTWDGEAKKIICDSHGNLIGCEKYFKFTEMKNNSNDPKKKVEWKMHEYSFDPKFMPKDLKQEYQDFVICRISKKMIGKGLDKDKKKTIKCLHELEKPCYYDHNDNNNNNNMMMMITNNNNNSTKRSFSLIEVEEESSACKKPRMDNNSSNDDDSTTTTTTSDYLVDELLPLLLDQDNDFSTTASLSQLLTQEDLLFDATHQDYDRVVNEFVEQEWLDMNDLL